MILGMLVIGGTSTVSGAVFGCFLVTFAFEGLRSIEGALNRAQVFTEQVVGLTEVALALAMIGDPDPAPRRPVRDRRDRRRATVARAAAEEPRAPPEHPTNEAGP